MFGRKQMAGAVDEVTPYVDQLAHDEKLRERLAAALTAGLAARRRAQRQAGLIGLATRLGSDPVLRAQIAEALSQLQQARSRVQKRRSHTLRNVFVVLAVGGAIAAALKARAGEEPDPLPGVPES